MNDRNSLLSEQFDRIDATELDKMKNRREEESLNLDFKRLDASGEPNDFDKRNLREAISGYANSAGGIILWGVESKSGEHKWDRSRFQTVVPIRDGERAAARLHELTATATQPPVSNVRHVPIAVPEGFVVKTFVPASDAGPHRTNEDKGHYYRRDADSFRAMQHHEIADMFGRRSRPLLEIYHSALRPVRYSTGAIAEFTIGLRNIGRGIARFPRLVLNAKDKCAAQASFGLDGNNNSNLRQEIVRQGSSSMVFAGGANDVIHPQQLLEVTVIELYKVPNSYLEVGTIEYTIFAENMTIVQNAIKFTYFDLPKLP